MLLKVPLEGWLKIPSLAASELAVASSNEKCSDSGVVMIYSKSGYRIRVTLVKLIDYVTPLFIFT